MWLASVALPLEAFAVAAVGSLAFMSLYAAAKPGVVFEIPGVLHAATQLRMKETDSTYGAGALVMSAVISATAFATLAGSAVALSYFTRSPFRARISWALALMQACMCFACCVWASGRDVYVQSEFRPCAMSLAKASCAWLALTFSRAIGSHLDELVAAGAVHRLAGDGPEGLPHLPRAMISLGDIAFGAGAAALVILLRIQPGPTTALPLALTLAALAVPLGLIFSNYRPLVTAWAFGSRSVYGGEAGAAAAAAEGKARGDKGDASPPPPPARLALSSRGDLSVTVCIGLAAAYTACEASMPWATQWSDTFVLCTIGTVFSTANYVIGPTSFLIRVLLGMEEHAELSRALAHQTSLTRQERAANDSRRRWVRWLMHELRQPHQSMLLGLKLLRDDSCMSEDSRDILAQMELASTSALHVMNSVLDFASLEADKFVLKPAPGPLGPLLRRVVGAMTPWATSAGVTLALEWGPGLRGAGGAPSGESTVVTWDGPRVCQILSGFISNAIKSFSVPSQADDGGDASPSAAVKRVTVTAARVCQGGSAHMIRLAVDDNGCGIAPEALGRLFVPFQRGGTYSSGTGLGLSIAKQIIEKHAGSVGVSSEPGRGSSFFVMLPLELEAATGATLGAPVSAAPSVDARAAAAARAAVGGGDSESSAGARTGDPTPPLASPAASAALGHRRTQSSSSSSHSRRPESAPTPIRVPGGAPVGTGGSAAHRPASMAPLLLMRARPDGGTPTATPVPHRGGGGDSSSSDDCYSDDNDLGGGGADVLPPSPTSSEAFGRHFQLAPSDGGRAGAPVAVAGGKAGGGGGGKGSVSTAAREDSYREEEDDGPRSSRGRSRRSRSVSSGGSSGSGSGSDLSVWAARITSSAAPEIEGDDDDEGSGMSMRVRRNQQGQGLVAPSSSARPNLLRMRRVSDVSDRGGHALMVTVPLDLGVAPHPCRPAGTSSSSSLASSAANSPLVGRGGPRPVTPAVPLTLAGRAGNLAAPLLVAAAPASACSGSEPGTTGTALLSTLRTAAPSPDACGASSGEPTPLPSPTSITSRTPASASGSDSLPSAPRLRVLVVDDVATARKLLVRVLTRKLPAGVVLVEAGDGAAAVAAVASATSSGAPFSVVLLDKEMPVMDGYDAARALRAAGFAGLIVGVTGNAMAEDVAGFKAAGVDEVVAKPVDLEVLLGLIRAAAAAEAGAEAPVTPAADAVEAVACA